MADAYGWDPGTFLDGVPEEAVLGVEAPLWTETVETFDQVQYMAFPRLAAIAELGWSPAAARDWPDFARRLATHGPRWTERGVTYYRSVHQDIAATNEPPGARTHPAVGDELTDRGRKPDGDRGDRETAAGGR